MRDHERAIPSLEEKWAWPHRRGKHSYAKESSVHAASSECNVDNPSGPRSLKHIPDIVLTQTMDAADWLKDEKNNIDPNNPKTIPSHMTAEQVISTINLAALYEGEFEKRHPGKRAAMLEAKAKTARIATIHLSEPIKIEPIQLNGTNGHAQKPFNPAITTQPAPALAAIR